MIRYLTPLAVGLLALTSCSAAVEGTNEAASQVASPSRESLTVSRQATCQTLVGDDGGIVSESGQFLTDIDELSEANAKRADEIADGLEGIAETATDDLQKLLRVMQEPFRDLSQATRTGDNFKLDPSRFKAAANELLSKCGESETDPSPSASTALPTAGGLQITGDYAADLTSHGLVTDDLEYYKNFMKEGLCESDVSSRAIFYQKVRLRVGSPTDPTSEKANQARVNIAYLCPERMDNLEEALAYLASE